MRLTNNSKKNFLLAESFQILPVDADCYVVRLQKAKNFAYVCQRYNIVTWPTFQAAYQYVMQIRPDLPLANKVEVRKKAS